jgi:hypothetical protein
MTNNNTVEERIDRIRDSIYEEIKNMSVHQRTQYFRALAEQARCQYGITTEKISAGKESIIAE